MKARDLGTSRGDAKAYAEALKRCSLYTQGGRPPFPRCDGPQWGDPQIRVGSACPSDPCSNRARPMSICRYPTDAASLVLRVTAGPTAGHYVVPAVPGHEGLEGESVAGVDLSYSLLRDLTTEERASLERIPPESVL